MSKSNNNCCVVGCSNTYKNSSSGTQFYSFPSAARFPGRKQLWINAVRRINHLSGNPWLPTKNSFVCSTHFIGGVKKDHPHHPAYVPSIFPEVYKNNLGKYPLNKVKRFNRLKKRTDGLNAEIILPENHEIDTSSAEEELSGTQTDASTNCCFPEDSHEEKDMTVLFCFKEGNNCGTQTYIRHAVKVTSTSVQTDTDIGNEEDFDEQLPTGFRGMLSISSDEKLKVMTGVTFSIFNMLLLFVTGILKGKSHKVQPEDRLIIFLMKMKLGVCFSTIGIIFGIHRTTASRIFLEILNIVYNKTCDWVYWPSKSIVKSTMPQIFIENFPNCRAIIDCTEIKTERPSNVEQQVLFWSNYKNAFTLKFLVAITPGGYISFVSACYGGRTSDSYITNDCGLLDLIEQGDILLADKGFPGISAELSEQNVLLVMPPFSNGGQFSKEEVEETYKIASVRIHVERIIQRIKIYEILHKIENEQLPFIDKIVRTCCVLANLQTPIIKQ